MLTHFIGILCLASLCGADVPSRLYAVSHVKGIIHELQGSLMDFRRNVTNELTELETHSKRIHKNDTCWEQIFKAHNASRRLLNMLVEGEYSGLRTAEESLEKMSLNDISKLWGTLGPGGKSRMKMKKEMDDFEATAKERVREAMRDCETTAPADSVSTEGHFSN